MGIRCVLALVCYAVGGAAELLAAFHAQPGFSIELVPLGLVFAIAGLALCHGHHHP